MKFDTTNNSHRIFSQEVYEKVSAIRGKNPECAKKIEVALNAKGCFFLQNINFIMRMLDNREYDIALEKSLLLPDVCGKAEGWLNKSGKPLNSMDRYKEWLNQYIIPCNTVPSSSISLFTADELCQIRNALIHEQRLVLGSGEINHSGSGENRQFWSNENHQSGVASPQVVLFTRPAAGQPVSQ